MNMQKILTGLVRTSVFARQLAAPFYAQGYHDNPYERIFGELADVIYEILGEQTDTFEESSTCHALCPEDLHLDQRMAIVLGTLLDRWAPTNVET